MTLPRQDSGELDRLRRVVARVVADPQFPQALEALNAPQVEAQARPQAFLRGQGLDVPDDVGVTVEGANGGGEEVAARGFRLEKLHGKLCFHGKRVRICVTVDTTDG
jgi:hypothetical protein